MKSRYLFRGKTKQLETWVTGYYFYSEKEDKHYIMGESIDYGLKKYEVDQETVGQCTGLQDKNGVLVFEGDILYVYECGRIAVVFMRGCFGYGQKWDDFVPLCYSTRWVCGGEVIGNIHDNKDLLGGDAG